MVCAIAHQLALSYEIGHCTLSGKRQGVRPPPFETCTVDLETTVTKKTVRFEIVEPDDAVYADYSSNFSSYNERQSGWEIQTFSIVSHEGDRISAGGRGHVYLGALELRGLWVDEELRGQGIGTVLLARIEKEGANRGAKLSWLYTYSW